ncbi:hypothetical protein TI04_10275, partial [Achromatium sp. WMS2]
MDQEQQQLQLKQLITRGKEQGFLTYTDINDHLPPDVESEQIDDIIHMINDMGIMVHETAPDSDSLMGDLSADDDIADVEVAAFALVDSDFGRTTDPVRMYMREMGTVELLTREGELKIARRIEDGLNQVQESLSHYPKTIEKLIAFFDRVSDDGLRISDIISGLADSSTSESVIADESNDNVAHVDSSNNDVDVEDSNDDDDDSNDELAVLNDAGPDLNEVVVRMERIRILHKELLDILKTRSIKDHRCQDIQAQITTIFLELKLVPNVFNELISTLRSTVERIRAQEKSLIAYCVEQGGMPRASFIESFVGNETNTHWLDEQITPNKPYAKNLQ